MQKFVCISILCKVENNKLHIEPERTSFYRNVSSFALSFPLVGK